MRRLIAVAIALAALSLPASAGAVSFKEFTLGTTTTPVGVTQGPDGNMWIALNLGQEIVRLNPATGDVTGRTRITTSGAAPLLITSGPDGNLWFTDDGGTIGQLRPPGFVTQFTPPTSGGTHGITTGPDGALWYTMRNSAIVGRITTDGTFTEFPLPAGTTSTPARIAPGADGNLWFTEENPGAIGRISPLGVITEFPIPTSGADPIGIAAGPDGALWFTERLTGKIGRITTAGVITEFPMPGGGQPRSITAGPDGAMWFVDELNDKLGRLTTDGQMTLYDMPGTAQASEIASGPNQTLWITRGGNAVDRVDLLPPPTVGKTVNAEPVKGTVLVRSPKSKKFVRLGADGKQIPTGSELDTRKGTVSLTAAKGTGQQGTFTSDFFDGVFTVTQARSASAVTEAKLTGPLEGCAKKRDATTAARKGRRLWGRGKGRFRTRGRRSSTTVRGTTWLVEDRCDGSTVTTVKEGTVEVQAGKKKVIVKAPGSFVAKR
jgi:streptogramin lyase